MAPSSSSTTTTSESNFKNKSLLFRLTDIENQFAFYGQYHTNSTNVLIHILCVPLIFWSALVLSHRWIPTNLSLALSSSVDLSSTVFDNLPNGDGGLLQKGLELFLGGRELELNFGVFVAWIYATYFIILEPVAGLLYAPILFFMGQSSTHFYNSNPVDHFWIALGLHVVCWIAQFIGHGKFEGRAPALLDNLFQSVVLAVFFVFMEVLFGLGYRPELHKRVNNQIGKEVVRYRRERAEREREKAMKAKAKGQ